jgi:hypothetical protein
MSAAMSRLPIVARKGVAGLLGLAFLALGCAMPGPHASRITWNYFRTPDPADPWSPKIAGWQSRERAVAATAERAVPDGASVSADGAGDAPSVRGGDERLRAKYFAFRQERKREMAEDVARWIQKQARSHYRPDGAIDHWATLEETLERDGDDCDGLELLVYYFLRDLGFGEDEVFRAIVVRPSDGQHHMVTLWFERADDPWVIDPTGAMTSGMPRMSEVAGWRPLKIFGVDAEYSARPLPVSFETASRQR